MTQSRPQKEVVERVMHEWKHGELKDKAGDTVTDRKQAVAIGLSEAGASDRQTPAQNKQRLRQSKARQRRGDTEQAAAEGDATRAELHAEARKRDVPGRSRMSKAELAAALKR